MATIALALVEASTPLKMRSVGAVAEYSQKAGSDAYKKSSRVVASKK